MVEVPEKPSLEGLEKKWSAAWEADRTRPLPAYPAGSEGPEAAAALLSRDGRQWNPIA